MTDHEIECQCRQYVVAIGCQDWVTVDRICDLAKLDGDLHLAITSACIENFLRFADLEKITERCQEYHFAIRSEDWKGIDQIWQHARFNHEMEEAFHEFHVAVVAVYEAEVSP